MQSITVRVKQLEAKIKEFEKVVEFQDRRLDDLILNYNINMKHLRLIRGRMKEWLAWRQSGFQFP